MNELIILMKKYNLKTIDVAKILNVSPTTVRIWRSKAVRCITNNDLQLLKLLIKDKKDD
jgi:DNA-binding transcriptional regulator YiaG